MDQLMAALREVVRTAQVEPLTVSIEEAAKRLGVSAATIRRMVCSGLLHSVRIGKRRMVPMSELKRLANPTRGSRSKSTPPAASPRGRIRALTRR